MRFFMTKDRGRDGSVFFWAVEHVNQKPEFNEDDGFWDAEDGQTIEVMGPPPVKIGHSKCVEVSIKRKIYKIEPPG